MALKILHSRLGENSETLTYIANKNVLSSTVTNAKLERLTQEFLDLKQVIMVQNRKLGKADRKGPREQHGKRSSESHLGRRAGKRP